MLAPDDTEMSLVLSALQCDGLPGRKLCAQSTQPAADVTDIKGVSQLRGQSFAGLPVHPHAQWQNHLGARAALTSFRHRGKLTSTPKPATVTEVMANARMDKPTWGRVSGAVDSGRSRFALTGSLLEDPFFGSNYFSKRYLDLSRIPIFSCFFSCFLSRRQGFRTRGNWRWIGVLPRVSRICRVDHVN